MAGKQVSGDSLSSNLAGMSKNQLYDIMSQMKLLIEQNHQQARKILIQNPLLTKALFQAQIMLGMVQAPQAVPSIQPQVSPQPPPPPVQQTNATHTHSTPTQISLPDQTNVSQVPLRKHQQSQPSLPIASIPPSLPPQQTEPRRGPVNSQPSQMPHQQSSQVPNMAPLPIHSGPQPPMQSGPGHLLQPPLPPQPRPPIQMQYQPQIGANMNFPNSGMSQMRHSQPMFHTSNRPPLPGVMGPFPQGQPPPHHPPHQPLYQAGGSHMSGDFNNQGGGNMQGERPPSWPPASRENSGGTQVPILPSLNRGPLPVGNQPPRPPPLTPEVEQQLLQQVMSLTPEQINLLPPEQRHQVLQLQQMLRQ